MQYPNTYYYFLKENYPEVISEESGVSVAKLPLERPKQEKVVIAGIEYQILEHQVVIYEDLVADLPRQSNYNYVAILGKRGSPFVKMEVELDARNFQNSSVTIHTVADTHDTPTSLDDDEINTIKRMATLFSTPGMREIHSKKRFALQRVIGTYFTQIKEVWNAKGHARLSLVNDLIVHARQMLFLGGQDFVPLLELLQRNLEKKREIEGRMGFEIVNKKDAVDNKDQEEDYDIDETSWLEISNTETGESHTIANRSNMEFKEKYAVINFPDGEIKERVAAQSVGEMHDIYWKTQELASIAVNSNVAVSFSKIKQILKVMNITLRTIAERLKEVLLRATDESELSEFNGSPALRFLDDGILAELVVNRKLVSLAWLLNSGNFAVDLISLVYEQQELSLLELAERLNEQDIFGILLREGANPIFVTRNNRCFAHDILQANLSFAQILCAVNTVNGSSQAFFKDLARIVGIWGNYAILDCDVEYPELGQICSRYLGYSTELDIQELKFPDDHLAKQFVEARGRTGLSEDFIRRFMVVNSFQEVLREFLVAYQRFDERYKSVKKIPAAKDNLIHNLVSYLQNNYIVTEKSNLRKTINLLAKATKAINGAMNIILTYEEIENNKSFLNPSDLSESRKTRLANNRLSSSVEAQEKDVHSFIGSAETHPSSGGFWGNVFSTTPKKVDSQEVDEEQQQFIFARPLLDILRSAGANSEYKVASMI